jgi:hypothetical protein
MSRFEANHRILEEELGGKVFNMALPQGGGIRPARIYFEHFIGRGNRAATLIYFLDPFVLFCEGANERHKFVYFEPMKLPFLFRLLRDGYPPRRIFTYIRSKFTTSWFFQQPEPLRIQKKTLAGTTPSPEHIRLRIESLYEDGLSRRYFARYSRELARIAEHCREADMDLLVIVPPTLLGEEPGMAILETWLREQGLPFHNFVNAMPDPKWYYNLDHLNTEGVRHFLHVFVRPLLHEKTGPEANPDQQDEPR